MVRGLVHRVEHFFAVRGGHDNAGKDGALVAMLEERVFDYELGPHVSKCFQRGICFQLVCIGARVNVQVINYSCDCRVSALQRDPVGACVEEISFCDKTSVGQDASRELSGDLSVN